MPESGTGVRAHTQPREFFAPAADLSAPRKDAYRRRACPGLTVRQSSAPLRPRCYLQIARAGGVAQIGAPKPLAYADLSHV